ncbi:hypothetical protein DS67_00090 [Mesotoga sp. SC_4PWA21]|nr:hypothetical protein DS67_00090 [Mesotoga sp. SC_4PWA21]
MIYPSSPLQPNRYNKANDFSQGAVIFEVKEDLKTYDRLVIKKELQIGEVIHLQRECGSLRRGEQSFEPASREV